MRQAVAAVLFLVLALAAGARPESYLEWTFERGPAGVFHPRTVAWRTGEQVAWQAELPERWRQTPAGFGEAEYLALTRHPHDALRYMPNLCGVLTLDESIAIGGVSGFLVLSKRDGHTLLDVPCAASDAPYLFFDRGHYEVRWNGRKWSGPTRRATFLAQCGEHVVCFNGSTVIVAWTQPWRVVRTIEYDPTTDRQDSRPGVVRALLRSDDFEVLLEGNVYLR